MTDLICKTCQKSIWVHQIMDYSGEWKEGDSCEEFVGETEVVE